MLERQVKPETEHLWNICVTLAARVIKHTQSYQETRTPQARGPGGLSGHMTLQQEVDVQLREQQQDVGEHADDRHGNQRHADAPQTPRHAHLSAGEKESDSVFKTNDGYDQHG